MKCVQRKRQNQDSHPGRLIPRLYSELFCSPIGFPFSHLPLPRPLPPPLPWGSPAKTWGSQLGLRIPGVRDFQSPPALWFRWLPLCFHFSVLSLFSKSPGDMGDLCCH